MSTSPLLSLVGDVSRRSRLLFRFNMASKKVLLSRKHDMSDMASFREVLASSRHLVILTGAGVSAESGVPTFRGAGGFWRTYQNIDGLHKRAGSSNIIELHGNLFKTRCTKCGDVSVNTDSPICEALRDRGAPNQEATSSRIPVSELPKCKKDGCGGLLRPHVVWFGECLDSDVLDAAGKHLEKCDLCLVVGTSSIVYPAAMFAPEVARRGVPVAEFNLESTPVTGKFANNGYHFSGACGEILPGALAP